MWEVSAISWSAPRTWTTNLLVTATIMNTEVRDNFLETFPAKAATAGYFGRVTGTNAIEEADPTDGDKLDGDKLDIDWTPTNYTPTASPSEADDVNDLTAHLAGIDAVIASSASSQSTQAALEAETNENSYAPPDLIKHSPGVGKGYCRVAADGTLNSNSYNVASVTDTGTGIKTILWDVDFSNTDYSCTATIESDGSADQRPIVVGNVLGASVVIRTFDDGGTLADRPTHCTGHGDQA